MFCASHNRRRLLHAFRPFCLASFCAFPPAILPMLVTCIEVWSPLRDSFWTAERTLLIILRSLALLTSRRLSGPCLMCWFISWTAFDDSEKTTMLWKQTSFRELLLIVERASPNACSRASICALVLVLTLLTPKFCRVMLYLRSCAGTKWFWATPVVAHCARWTRPIPTPERCR